MWWIGFRCIYSGTQAERVYDCGGATLLGPYKTRDLAKEQIKYQWDAKYSAPFEASDLSTAQEMVEGLTPKK